MMFREAAEIARKCSVRQMILTHFSTSLDAPEESLCTAVNVFPDTVAGADGMLIRLNYPKEQEPAGIEISRKEDW